MGLLLEVFMKYEPIFTYQAVIFDLQKPIYQSFFGIWDKWLKKAQGRRLIVKTPYGTATYPSAKDWMNGAERLERYYKNPDEPMVFWGRSVKPDIKERFERKKKEMKEKVSAMEGLARLPHKKIEQLRMEVFGN